MKFELKRGDSLTITSNEGGISFVNMVEPDDAGSTVETSAKHEVWVVPFFYGCDHKVRDMSVLTFESLDDANEWARWAADQDIRAADPYRVTTVPTGGAAAIIAEFEREDEEDAD